MELVTRRVDKKLTTTSLNGGRTLSLYNEAPTEEITLDEFELFALDRLQLLRSIESLRNKGYEESEFKSRLDSVWYSFCSLLSG
jgi:DNA primase large subunit